MTPEGPSRLELIVSAIAGSAVEVAAGEPGEPPWTDGAVVYVDETMVARDQLRSAAVQAALLAGGSLDPELLAGLDRRRALLHRYLSIEGHRALAASETFLPLPVRAVIDRATADRSSGPEESLALARGREELPEPPAVFGAIRPRHVLATRLPGARAEEAVAHTPRRDANEELRELDDGEDTEQDGATDLFSPAGGSGPVGRLLARLLGSSRSKSTGPPGADAATHRSARAGRVSARGGVSTGRAASVEDLVDPRRSGVSYPEWNYFDRRYRPDWCTVTEFEPDLAGAAPWRRPDGEALRRSLARLGLDLARQRRQPHGDDLDLDATIAARVEMLAGSQPDESVYLDNLRRRRELSVLILLDVSGSSGEPSPSGGTVHEHQREVAGALMAALHDLGDRVALYGFRSQGRRSVQVAAVKRFDDRLDARVRHRLGALVPGAYTRLGAAIRHGASVLETEGGTVRRLLIVLSDGFAYDHGYQGAYGEADARRALAEARRRGTACLCLSVGAGTDADALRRVFGTAAHALIPRPAQLPATAASLFRSALRLAEVQRRQSQRNERARQRLHIERSSA